LADLVKILLNSLPKFFKTCLILKFVRFRKMYVSAWLYQSLSECHRIIIKNIMKSLKLLLLFHVDRFCPVYLRRPCVTGVVFLKPRKCIDANVKEAEGYL